MKNLLSILTATWLLTACGQTASNSTNPSAIPTPVNAETPKSGDIALTTNSLDSIDKANNESVLASGDDITKVYVNASDSSMFLAANIRRDHRIFGYAQPDIHSKRLFLLSVFTNDVENNPFGCELGAYYDTGDMQDLSLKFVAKAGDFIKAVAINKESKETTIYFEKKWIEFEAE